MAKTKKRRIWTEAQKRKILKQIDKLRKKGERGDIGVFLKEQGLYSSVIATWRKSLGETLSHTGKRPGPKPGRKPGPKPGQPRTYVRRAQSEGSGTAVVALAQENNRLRAALQEVGGRLVEAMGGVA